MPKYKNILLINAWQAELFPAPSIGYLQAAIKQHFGNSVSIIARDIDDAIQLLSAPNDFDLIGASFHSFSVKYAKQIRALAIGKTLICGGHHPSALPEQMINIGYDHIVIGEGENAIIDIIDGVTSEQIVRAENATPYYTSVDEYPEPDYTGLKVNITPDFGFIMISSRGCPFRCNFCASSIFWDRKIKMRSPENVVSEIEKNIKLYNCNSFMFEDDNFTMKKSRALEICNGINQLSRKYGKISWQCASRAEVLVDELCAALKRTGCHTVWLGVESLSQPSLDRCEKHTTVQKMISGITNAEKHGLRTMSQFIIGLPDDSIEDVKETTRQIRNTPMSRFGCNTAWILPNTNIYNKAKQAGFDESVYLESGAPFYTHEQDMNTLNTWCNIINNAKR